MSADSSPTTGTLTPTTHAMYFLAWAQRSTSGTWMLLDLTRQMWQATRGPWHRVWMVNRSLMRKIELLPCILSTLFRSIKWRICRVTFRPNMASRSSSTRVALDGAWKPWEKRGHAAETCYFSMYFICWESCEGVYLKYRGLMHCSLGHTYLPTLWQSSPDRDTYFVAKAWHGACVVEVGQTGLIHLGSEIQHTNKHGPQCMHESESESVDSRGGHSASSHTSRLWWRHVVSSTGMTE